MTSKEQNARISPRTPSIKQIEARAERMLERKNPQAYRECLSFVAKTIALDPAKRTVYLSNFVRLEQLVAEGEAREAAMERVRRLAAS